jgi:hypothetical protein
MSTPSLKGALTVVAHQPRPQEVDGAKGKLHRSQVVGMVYGAVQEVGPDALAEHCFRAVWGKSREIVDDGGEEKLGESGAADTHGQAETKEVVLALMHYTPLVGTYRTQTDR